ncbi:MAG TPA: YbgC/FadM family acyl-CoA thioesterase [Nitrospira sp.]|nr:YbgC/FadM family acyl-CoA thioesterase [Nitrospira sp.]
MEQRPEGRDVIEIRIYYEDTDCGGIVYYANYLKYFERARTQYLEARRLSVMDLMNAGRVFVVVHAEIEYRAPARYGETLEIETTISEMNPAAMTFSHVVRERQSRRLVVEGAARLAVTDGNGKVRRLDKVTVAALQSNPPEC